MIEVLEEPEFKKLQCTGQAFFTRKGGISNGYYHSLNCTYHSSDNPQHIEENQRRNCKG
jgi:copper oxidase (laccase) domain-containing protein